MASVESRSFLPGEKVALFRRTGGGPLHRGAGIVRRQKVSSDGIVNFDGLRAGETFYVAREDGSSAIAVTAKDPAQAKSRLSEKEVRSRLRGTVWQEENRTVVEGARNTASRGGLGQPFVSPESGSKTPKEIPADPRHPRVEDFRSVPVRSATVTGLATPIAGDPRPEGVPQSEAEGQQSSATEHGMAQPREPARDPAEGPRQEDAARGLEQASATQTGIQAPIPATREGKPDTATRKPQSKQSAPKQKDAAARKRSEASRKAAATRKRNQQKASRSSSSSGATNRRSSGRKR